MSATTYGSDSLRALTTNRVTSLQRPFQLFILAGDFLLILFSDMAAGALYRCLMGSAADGTMALMSYVISSSTRATSMTTQPGVAKFAASSGNRVRPAWT